jgi:NAD(P)-dependent dehydrogenase (short-subunit alcohol dehydrogenase family)
VIAFTEPEAAPEPVAAPARACDSRGVKDLANKVAWITGAASGIGLALAHRLAAEQMKLVLVDIEEGPLREAEAALTAKGATVLALKVDVGDGAAMTAATRAALDKFGIVHLIINNAGVGGGGGPMWELTEADWKWAMDVNLWGVIHAIRLLLPPLLASGEEGHVLSTASVAGLLTTPFMGPYTATKHAVVAVSECLSKELELANAKVGVSVLCPGFVKTNIANSHRNRPAALTAKSSEPGERAKQFATVLQQMVAAGKPVEVVADACVDAIRAPHFYVLTHPEMKPQVEHRMRQILEEKQPGIDPLFRSMFQQK